MVLMHAVVTVFVFVVTALSAGRLLVMEQKDLSLRSGISDFSGKPSALDIMIPIVAVTGLFMIFAWLNAEKIRKMRLTVLVAQQ